MHSLFFSRYGTLVLCAFLIGVTCFAGESRAAAAPARPVKEAPQPVSVPARPAADIKRSSVSPATHPVVDTRRSKAAPSVITPRSHTVASSVAERNMQGAWMMASPQAGDKNAQVAIVIDLEKKIYKVYTDGPEKSPTASKAILRIMDAKDGQYILQLEGDKTLPVTVEGKDSISVGNEPLKRISMPKL